MTTYLITLAVEAADQADADDLACALSEYASEDYIGHPAYIYAVEEAASHIMPEIMARQIHG
jgi:hypothetical protein